MARGRLIAEGDWTASAARPPEYIQSHNGAEVAATATRKWLHRLDVQTLFIEPGSPCGNAGNESFNSAPHARKMPRDRRKHWFGDFLILMGLYILERSAPESMGMMS